MGEAIFKYLDRGYQKAIVLIPGWAADYRIFDSLDLKFNYLLPLNFSPFTFEKSLLNVLRDKGIAKVSLFGWSLGGFLGVEFALKHKDLIDELILISVRKKYKEKEIAVIKELLKKSKKGYLYKFYARCFFKKISLSRFKENLFKSYCEQFDLEYLFAALDYLGRTKIEPKELDRIERVKIIHGEADKIAPIKEARSIKNSTRAEFIAIKNSGHIPFLEVDLGKYIW